MFSVLRWWHWVSLGSVAGVLLAIIRLWAGSDEMIGGPGFIDQPTFESALRHSAKRNEPIAKDLHVYPEDGFDLVEIRYAMPGPQANADRTVRFAAPVPYVPLQDPRSNSTEGVRILNVVDYIAACGTTAPIYYAWWATPAARITSCAVIGAAGGGGLWWMVLVFSGPTRETRAKVIPGQDSHGCAVNAGSAPAADIESIVIEIERLERELNEGPGGWSAPESGGHGPPPATPLVLSSPVADEARPTAHVKAIKEYRGEFYPVAHPSPRSEAKAPAPDGNRAFSIVELIVAVAIATLLLSMLFPVLRVTRQSAEQVKCAEQLHQLGIALEMYSNQNHGWLPAWSGWHVYPPGSPEDDPGVAWTEMLEPYYVKPNSPLYHCPSFPEQNYTNYFIVAQWAGTHNLNSTRLNEITMASRFILSGDVTQRSLYPAPFGFSSHRTDDCDRDDFGANCLAFPEDPGGFWMHRKGNNVLFDDFHVALYSHFDSIEMTFHPHLMKSWSEVSTTLD